MLKRLIILLVILGICCALVYVLFVFVILKGNDGDSALKDRVVLFENEENCYVVYEDMKFSIYKGELFRTIVRDFNADDSIQLGWSDSFVGYNDYFYSSQINDPVYIYEIRSKRLFLRDNYDYRMDTFIINGIDKCDRFSDALTYYDVSFEKLPCSGEFVLYCQSHPELKTEFKVFRNEGVWYAYAGLSHYEIYTMSEELLQILVDNKIISQ